MSYARGRLAWGECQRSGIKTLLRNLVPDGDVPGLMVLPAWREPVHPQEIPIEDVSDPIALLNPSPDQSVPTDEGTAAPELTFDSTGKLV